MTPYEGFQRVLKAATVASFFLAVNSEADPILSLTFDDPNGVFAEYSEGVSLRDLQNTSALKESEITTAIGGKAQLNIDTSGWEEGGSEPPKSFQLVADSVMGTKSFLRLLNSKQIPGTRGLVVVKPDGFETSLASLSHIENGKLYFSGGLDMFFRYSEEGPSQSDLVPNLLFIGGAGLRLIAESDGGSIVAGLHDAEDKLLFDTDLDGVADAKKALTSVVRSAPIEPEAVHHLAIAFQTSETGVVTVKVFLKAGNGAINTSEETDLVSEGTFSVITDDAEMSLEKDGFSIGADSRSSPEKAILDLAAFRIFKPAPAIFPDISGKE